MVSPPEWWPGRCGDKTPVCNGAFIKGRDAETVPCRIPEGVGDSLQAQSWDPALEKPRYLSKHELFKSIKNFTQPVFIRF